MTEHHEIEVIRGYIECGEMARAADVVDELIAEARAPLEAQLAQGIDVERLARAIARVAEVGPAHHLPEEREDHWESYRAEAEEYAREYAALTALSLLAELAP